MPTRTKPVTAAASKPVPGLVQQIREKFNRYFVVAEDFKYGKHNDVTPDLLDILIAQEVISEAEKLAKDRWQNLEKAGAVKSKEDCRALGEGEHTIGDGASLFAFAKVAKPGSQFDKEAFIADVALKFKIPMAKLTALAEDHKKEKAAAVERWVAELKVAP